MSTGRRPGSRDREAITRGNELLPPKSLVQNARLKDYAAEYKQSVKILKRSGPPAASELEWFQPWTKVFEWKYPTFEWFQGANRISRITALIAR